MSTISLEPNRREHRDGSTSYEIEGEYFYEPDHQDVTVWSVAEDVNIFFDSVQSITAASRETLHLKRDGSTVTILKKEEISDDLYDSLVFLYEE